MRPKGKLFALLAVFMAIGVVAATGAFTTVSADRTANIETSGDSSALLGLSATDGPNGDEYVTTSNGQLQLTNLTTVNPNATTEIDNVINITNNGQQDVYIHIEKSGGSNGAVKFYNDTGYTNRLDNGNSMQLSSGQAWNVSIEIDTTGTSNGENLLNEITIVANQTQSP